MAVMTLMAAAAMPVGGWLAMIDTLRPRWLEEELRHTILAVGAGVLLAAVALVLIPEGTGDLGIAAISVLFVSGGLAFMQLDIWLAKKKTPAAQMAAMMADFVPESLALGALYAKSHGAGMSLALMIALQNIPEGFNAFREMAGSNPVRGRRVLWLMLMMVPLGPIVGAVGMFVMATRTAWIHGVMLFAAGGILYALFQDIAPQVRLNRSWAPPLGALLGFLFGLIGDLWFGA